MFPQQFAVDDEGSQAALLMERADPTPLDQVVFEDERRWSPRPDALGLLRGHLDLIEALHEVGARPQAPPVAAYLHRGRFTAIARHPGVRKAVEQLLPGWTVQQLLTAEVLLPGELEVHGYDRATAQLSTHVNRLVPASGALTHGDPHLRNLLRRTDGSACLIDPRTVWDGRDAGEPGYGDRRTTTPRCCTACCR